MNTLIGFLIGVYFSGACYTYRMMRDTFGLSSRESERAQILVSLGVALIWPIPLTGQLAYAAWDAGRRLTARFRAPASRNPSRPSR